METFTIGQLADAADVHVETVRYYERRGLIAEPPRTPAGYRQYSAADVWRLQFIARGKDLGFTLAEISEILGDDGQRPAERVLEAAQAKIVAVDAALQDLAATRSRLEQLIDLCEGGDAGDCASLRLVR